MGTKCAPGFASDNLLRLPMPVGPFADPVGIDCFRHELSFTVVSWFMLAVNLGIGGFALFELVCRRKMINRALSAGLFGQFMCALSAVGFCLLGLFAPGGCFGAWVSFSFWFWVWVIAYLGEGYQGALQVLVFIQKESIATILGGRLIALGVSVFNIMCFLAVMVGCVGTTAAVARNNIPLAVGFWGLHCAGNASFIALGMFYSYSVLGKFVDSLDSVPPAESNRYIAMREVKTRFKVGRRVFLIGLPAGLVAWFLHIFVLPLFWYIAYTHVFYNAVGTLASIYMYTPASRKNQLKRIFTMKTLNEIPVSTFVGTPRNKAPSSAIPLLQN